MEKHQNRVKWAGNIVITGAAGFIGSQVAAHLIPDRRILVDKLELFTQRGYNKEILESSHLIDAEQAFFKDLADLSNVSWVIHLGAITNTGEKDLAALKKWNVDYTKRVWELCSQQNVNLIYASSAATYGNGAQGFSDDHESLIHLEPLNPYGQSKNEFDLWAIKQESQPPKWYGLKFFNVYGPNENHKGRMASSVWHGYNEIKKTGTMTLFRSHNSQFKDGEQARDFIFIDDILSIFDFMMAKKPESGIYNCGTGEAGSFLSLAQGLFKSLAQKEKITWIDTPEEFRKGYQYRTQADLTKLRAAGYTRNFLPLNEGIKQYLYRIQN